MLCVSSKGPCVTSTARTSVGRARSRIVLHAPAAERGGVVRGADVAANGYVRSPELQAVLDGLFADSLLQGRRRVKNDEVAGQLEDVGEVAARLGLNRVVPEWNDGAFRSLLTTNTIGIDEQEVCTMARLTFGKVAPADLKVQLGQAEAAGLAAEPDQLKGPLARVADDPSRGYALVTFFKIVSNGVIGRMYAKALYDMDEEDPSRLNITFCGLQLEPAFSDPHSLALWRSALADHNPGMGPDGALYVPLEPRPRGHIRYVLMEPDLQLHIGNAGSLTALQRVA